MNKGIDFAKGRYLYFLNSGDIFYDHNTLLVVSKQLNAKSPDILYGDTSIVNSSYSEIGFIDNSSIDNLSILITAVNHQSIFINKAIFLKFGKYDLKYKVKADHDWFIRVYRMKENLILIYLNVPIVKYLAGGFSDQAKGEHNRAERKEIVKRHTWFPGLLFYKIVSSLFKLEKGSVMRRVCNIIILKS